MPIKNLAGKKFGKLTAIRCIGRKRKKALWECKCECGNIRLVTSDCLSSGNTKSCGCSRRKPHNNFKDICGMKFGLLTAIEPVENMRKHRCIVWKCRCECGNIVYVAGNCLRNGSVKSCGCLKEKARLKHGKARKTNKHPLYLTWENMKRRCYNKKNKSYNSYGGRGISVCNEWKNNFESFYDWAIANGWKRGLTIDRIDNNKGYSPDNCRWVSNKENSCRHRNNIPPYIAWEAFFMGTHGNFTQDQISKSLHIARGSVYNILKGKGIHNDILERAKIERGLYQVADNKNKDWTLVGG